MTGEQNRVTAASTGGSTGIPSLEMLYEEYRPYAFSIAYRMLGTVADAEDAVQDCFVELRLKPLPEIHHFKAFIAKMVVNRCLNFLNSARKQREAYIGEWLPEPLGDAGDGPAEQLERKDMLSYAFMVLLEQLTPLERAVFILREAFQYPYKDIASMLDITESNSRQLYSRSRRRLPSGEEAAAILDTDAAQTRRLQLLEQFTAAFMAYDVSSMLKLLAEKPVLVSDGGGQVITVTRPMIGQKGVLALLTSRKVFTSLRERRFVPVIMNGEPQLALLEQGNVTGAICLQPTPDGGHIEQVYIVLSPEKLQSIRVT